MKVLLLAWDAWMLCTTVLAGILAMVTLAPRLLNSIIIFCVSHVFRETQTTSPEL